MELADLQNIKNTVDRLVKKYETADPWILCEGLNIIVLISDLPIGVKGFYQLIKGRQIIHISRWVSNTHTQMKLVCAHELAHAILHKNQNICHRVGNAKMEKEAEYFKHYLLRLKVNEVSKWSREDISNFTHLSEDMINDNFRFLNTFVREGILFMKTSKFCAAFIYLSFLLFLTSCSTKKQTSWSDAKIKEKPYYNTEQYQPNNWEADTLWSQKIKMLSDTKIPSFDNLQELEKEYVLNLARYLQSMSPEGFLYDEKKQKYVISEADVQYFAKDLLGIDSFGYKESDEYNEKDATYECTEYPSYGFVNRTYDNKRIEKLSDSIWKFSVDVKENKENSQEFITEIYTVQDDANGYRMLSVKRIDSEGKEVTSDFKEDIAEI